MSHLRLVYASRPFGFDMSILSGILLDARRFNTRDNITGALIARADLYLQLLEGPAAAVESAYERIKRDDRHIEVRELVREATDERLFPGWSMRDDPARSWMWTADQVAEGAIDAATPEDVTEIFQRLRREGLN